MCSVHLTLLWSVMENDHGQESTCLDLCLKLFVSFILLCGAFLSTVIRHHDQGNLRKSLLKKQKKKIKKERVYFGLTVAEF